MKQVFGSQLDHIHYRTREGVYGVFKNDLGQLGVVGVRDTHFLVGGGIESNENHFETLNREFIEEIGYDIEILEYIGEFTEFHFADNINEHLKLVNHIYEVILTYKTKVPIEADHHLKWLTVDETDRHMRLAYQSYVLKTYNDMR